MEDKKDLLQSKATWGAIILLVDLIARSAGFDIGDQSMWVSTIVDTIGGALVLIGRFTAVKKIGSVAGIKVN